MEVVWKSDIERTDGRQGARSTEDSVPRRPRFRHEGHARAGRLTGVADADGERKTTLVEDVETDAQLVPDLRHRRDVARHLYVDVTTFRHLQYTTNKYQLSGLVVNALTLGSRIILVIVVETPGFAWRKPKTARPRYTVKSYS